MRRFAIVLMALGLASLNAGAQPAAGTARKPLPLPALKKNGAVTQMMVDGKPFIMLAGELHNSSASSLEYMKPVWEKLTALHLNTVIGTASWELVEPEEGKFDFTLVDAQVKEARQRNMRLVLIWFASWKNGVSSYAPLWVKTDAQRFPLMQTRNPGATRGPGGGRTLTPFGAETLAADAKAFRALMRHLRETDPRHTVIMMQVENEAGLLGDSRDRSPLAEEEWSKPVPAELTAYLARNKTSLGPELQELLKGSTDRPAGTWTEAFGKGTFADEIFMAWHIGRFVGKVAEAGKAELNIPMYANAWLGPQPGQTEPGQWPSGGPATRVLDIWRAAAPALDLLAPDIYVPNYKAVCATYARGGSALFIPEARAVAGNLFWALGQHSALGWSPFGIEDVEPDSQLAQAYKTLGGILPELAAWQAAGKLAGVLVESDLGQTVSLAGYKLAFNSRRPGAPATQTIPGSGPQGSDNRPFGLAVSIGPDEFLIIGSGLSPAFTPDSPGPAVAEIASIDEGRYEKGQWISARRLNGAEFRPVLRSGDIGMLRIKLYRHE